MNNILRQQRGSCHGHNMGGRFKRPSSVQNKRTTPRQLPVWRNVASFFYLFGNIFTWAAMMEHIAKYRILEIRVDALSHDHLTVTMT